MKDRFLKQARREYGPGQRAVALVLLAPVFLFLMPCIFVVFGAWLDAWLEWPSILSPPSNVLVGCLLILLGWSLAVWSMYGLFTIGRGTPVPLMATQQIVVVPPYTYCRNPMVLGAMGLYLGVAVLFGSFGALVLVLLAACALLVYVRRIEEAEMVLRFGDEYRAYRERTPFLLPRFRRRS
ncbi:methyltransferase family protein [Longivirga aurantiaca]|uniref:Methyltransferase family protein n=1 Tax=Longivirga aurantiaca TaxID=1837743 RepID=A0ABW1T389_9ACTN